MIHVVVDLLSNKVDTKGKEKDTEKFVFLFFQLTCVRIKWYFHLGISETIFFEQTKPFG